MTGLSPAPPAGVVTALDVARAVRGIIMTRFESNSCIETTRLLCAVLEHLGIRARPVAVDVDVFNAAARDAAARGVPIEQWPSEAHLLRIAPTGRPGGWPGHLVAVLPGPGGRRLIDASADQFHRPGRLEVVDPIITTLPQVWSPRDPWAVIPDGSDVSIVYAPIPPTEPRATAWRTSAAWTRGPDWYAAAVEHLAEGGSA